MNKDERGPWYLLTGVVLGLVLGLVYAWVINPVKYENNVPVSLRADSKDQYRALVAAAYAANGSLERAQARLAKLGDPDPKQVLAVQAQRALAEQPPGPDAYALGLLAVALSQNEPIAPASPPAKASPGTAAAGLTSPSPAGRVLTATAAAPTGTLLTLTQVTSGLQTSTPRSLTPVPTFAPLSTRTASPTAGLPFVLEDLKLVCDRSHAQPLIIIETRDAADQPVPGVEIVVSWDNGEDHFFTGLKPELGLGYADFAMTPGVTYTLRLMDGGKPEQGITPGECTSSGGSFWGSWRLVFVQR